MNPIFGFAFALFCFGGLIDLALVSGISTIRSGEKLNSTTLLVSDGGNFTLGFFTIPATNNSYLGIWHTNDEADQKMTVWVANPNTPISDKSGLLTIDTSGILKITSSGGTELNISYQVASNPTAKLEDSGNFVLSDESGKSTLWQSFDHPGNVLLPGMRLGFNTATGQNWSLTSWLSDSSPASGAFTLSWEPNQGSGQLVIHRRGKPYWASGILINQSFGFMPSLNGPSNEFHYSPSIDQSHYSLSSTNTGDEKSFSFRAPDGSSSLSWMMWLFKPNGEIKDVSNFLDITPPLAPDSFCYGYEADSGCVASQLPQCRSSTDAFQQKRAIFLPSVAKIDYVDNASLSLSDCMERCWNDCSCVGFQVLYSNDTGCRTWAGKLEYRQDYIDAAPKFVLVRSNVSLTPAGPSPSNLSPARKRWIWIVIAVVISLLVPTVGALY